MLDKRTTQDYWKSKLSKYITIGILALALIILLCCCTAPNSNAAKHPVQPKFHKGQTVYIFGETPGEIQEEAQESDNTFEYEVLVLGSDGSTHKYTWKEDKLEPYKNSPYSPYSVVKRDTVYEQIIVRANTLTDQQQWIDAEFMPYTLVKTRFCQSVWDDRQNHMTYSAEDVSHVLDHFIEAIDSVKKNLSQDLAAGNYPKK